MQKICNTCGTQHPDNFTNDFCFTCSEERQYIPVEGQTWTTHKTLLATHKNNIVKLNTNLYEIVISPTFAIGQRCFLIISKSGNILWDCIPLLDVETINFINTMGGLKGIAFSHPHYYSNMNDWAKIFDCSIYIHKTDEPYIIDKSKYVTLWDGEEIQILDDIKMINIGGHFDGSSILLIPSLSAKGTMLCGDTMYLSPSKKHFAIMYSYPNRIPLPSSEIRRIKERLNDIEFDAIFGFYSFQNLTENVKEILNKSIERYLE